MISKLNTQITRFGISESFNSFIEGLRETPGICDKKFRITDVNKMAQYLVCRNYGKVCLELSYLSWAVVNYQRSCASNNATNSSQSSSLAINNTPLLDFFWLNENITPSRFRHAFKSPYKNINNEIYLNEAGINIVIAKQSFVISPTRVGLLAVLLEIVITLAPSQLTAIEHALITSFDDKQADKAIKKLSSELQKQIYQFLAEHLVPAQQQRRFRYITQWLTSHNEAEKTANMVMLNDETIMSFWQSAALDDSSPGYKLYASALNDVTETHQAMQQAEQAIAIDNASSIGFNNENGEYSPEIIEEIIFNESSEKQDFTWLCQTPKFLTKSQWHFIEPLMQRQTYATTLALSFARLATFGHWQASLVQAKRKSAQALREKLKDEPERNYLQYHQQLSKQTNTIAQVVLAISHIFYYHQDSRYLGCILELLPQTTRQRIKDNLVSKMNIPPQDQQTSMLSSEKLKNTLFLQSQRLVLQSVELNCSVQEAKSAFNNNNKEGFHQIPAQEDLDIYQEGYEAITQCQKIIQACLKQLSNNWAVSKDCQQKYGSDVSIFKGMFDQLYGEVNE